MNSDLSQERLARPVFECPMCVSSHEVRPSRCWACGALLTFADLDAFFEPRVPRRAALLADGRASGRPIGGARCPDRPRMVEAVGRLELQAKQLGQPSNLWLLALAHMNLQHFRRALQSLRSASELSPEDFALRGLVQDLAQRLGGSSGAERAGDQVLAAHSLAGRRVLLVDDSPTVRKVLAFTLEYLGLEVLVASGGIEGLAQVRQQAPDLVLLDLQMPDLSGYQVCRLLKQDERTREIPVVMLTGRGSRCDRERSLEVGASAHITKPAAPAILLDTLQRCLLD